MACQSRRQSASCPLPTFELIITERLSLAWSGLAPEPPTTSQTAVLVSPTLMLILILTNGGISPPEETEEKIYGNRKVPFGFFLLPIPQTVLGDLVFISMNDRPEFSLEFERQMR